ncbi:hypothetical protein [Crenalkalicoccus roseus]|uniref:hypothetical protein n=1 Tax=Crenalkalicoccus roseus TaxID=1485588 RepID=UPI001080BE23|nr:hypothetical protein [Crenalkalicoccus roseus]
MLFVAWAWLIRGCPAALPIGLVLLLPWSFGMLVLTMPPFFGEPGMEEALPGPPVFLMLALA